MLEFRSDIGLRPVDDHYRRFINEEDFKQTLIDFGYDIEYFIHETDLSVCGEDNPYLIRCIGK